MQALFNLCFFLLETADQCRGGKCAHGESTLMQVLAISQTHEKVFAESGLLKQAML